MRPVEPDRGEIVEFGGPDRPPIRSGIKWLAAAVVVAVLAYYVGPARHHTRRAAPTPSAAVSQADPAGLAPPPTSSAPIVINLGRALFGATLATSRAMTSHDREWELFGRSDTEVIRIEPALGRITETPVPALTSGGPVSFLAMSDAALVVPFDRVVGYAVPDGRPAETLPFVLTRNGPALPGPDDGHLWEMVTTRAGPRLRLFDRHGKASGPGIKVPAGFEPMVTPDGGGYAIMTGFSGIYDISSAGIKRLGPRGGGWFAGGPTGWLINDLRADNSVVPTMVDRVTGKRREVTALVRFEGTGGELSPDGRHVAMLMPSGKFTIDGTTPIMELHVVDLATGADREVAAVTNVTSNALTENDQRMVWSPDGKWLFIAAHGIDAVHVSDLAVVNLGLPLPDVAQLAIRSNARS